MYKIPKYKRSQLTSVEKFEGETIEMKVTRILSNKESIKDGAPEIFTERKDGVLPGYNIRTDRFEVACEAMDKVHKDSLAKRMARYKDVELEATKESGNVGETESTQATRENP